MEPSPLKGHEDHIAGKGYNSMNHHNLAHKFFPIPEAVKIPDATRMKLLMSNTKKCLNHECLLVQLRNYQGGKNLTLKLLRGPTTWKDMLKNAWRDGASWQTNRAMKRSFESLFG